MSERRTVWEALESFGLYDLDGPLDDFLAKVAEVQSRKPGANLRIETDSGSDYGSGSVTIEYERLETDEEMAVRLKREEAWRKRQEWNRLPTEEQERRTLAALLAKYGPKPSEP